MNVYVQFASHSLKPDRLLINESKFVVLAPNTGWDDFGYKTTFDAHLAIEGSWEHLGELKIAVEGAVITSEALVLDHVLVDGTYFFEIHKNHISLPQSSRFYRRLKEMLTENEFENFLLLIGDVAFLEHRYPLSPSLNIRKEEVFRVSLLRNPGAVSAYGDAKEILFPNERIATRFDFKAEIELEPDNRTFEVSFKFAPRKDQLPANICVVIGRNGLGKTQVLKQVQHGLCGPVRGFESPDTHKPPAFREVIAVSFSPFEQFPHEEKAATKGRPAYRYCGFRNGEGKWDLEAALKTVGDNLAELVRDHLVSDGEKRPRLSLLVAALSIGREISRLSITRDGESWTMPDFLKRPELLADPSAILIRSEDVVFDGVPFPKMSAGQKMFLLVGTAICVNVQSESLFLIDEPELYLHPSFETEYFKMLHNLLKFFESFAIIATHSVFIARESPDDKVILLRQTETGETIVTEPTIRTFGGDIDAIANYVFDDYRRPKSYEETLNTIASEGLNYEEVANKYEGTLGVESLSYIRQRLDTKRRQNGSV